LKILRPASILGLIFFTILAGCAGLGKNIESPRITLASLRVQEFTGLETVFQIQLRVFNTNDVDLNVKGIEAGLHINGQPFAIGVSNTQVEIRAYSTELVPVTVYSSVINIIQSIRGFHESEQLNYLLKGKLRLAGESMLPATLPFESEGKVTLQDSKKLEK